MQLLGSSHVAVCTCSGGQEQEGIYYQGITGMKADMSGARTTPKLLELQEECLARDLSAGAVSSSDDSSDDEVDPDLLAKLACLEAPGIPAALQQDSASQPESHLQHFRSAERDSDAESEASRDDENSSQSGSDVLQGDIGDSKADRKAHKKAVKEANRERRKHKMPKHVKKKKMKSHKK